MTTPMFKTLMSRFAQSEVLLCNASASTIEGLLLGMTEHPLAKEALASSNTDDFWSFEPGSWRDQLRPYNVKDGILTIPVKGMLLHNFTFSFYDYVTGYEYIQRAYERGMGDADVKGIAFLVDSPGGMVAGCFDAIDKMLTHRGTKPVRAFAHEQACSAAYAIATVADHIVVSRTGSVGSIGVVTSHFDQSRALENEGYKVTYIHAGKHKVDGNSTEPLADDVKARIQATVDKLAVLFHATVANNRGISIDDVKATEALTYMGEDSLSVGLADSVGPLDDGLVTFKSSLTNSTGDFDMTKTEENLAAITQASVDAAHTDGLTKGRAEGATAERERINAILASDAGKSRPKAALAAALTTDMSLETASNFLGQLAEEAAVTATTDDTGADTNRQNFNNAMTAHAPDVGGDAGEPDADSNIDGSDDVALMKRFGLAGYA